MSADDAPTERDHWADVAKGIAIVCVVLFHGISLDTSPTSSGLWAVAGRGIFLFIMPVFFLASGIFGSRRLDLPWWEFFAIRVWPTLYLFIAWGLLYGLLALLSSGGIGASWINSVTLRSTLWFLAALPLYWVVAWVLHRLRVPRLVQVIGATLLALPFAIWLPFSAAGLGHTPHFLVWFLVGACCGERVLHWKARASWGWLFACIGAAAIISAVTLFVPGSGRYAYVLLAVPATLIMLIIAKWLTAVPRLGRLLATFGVASLVIYLVHPIVQSLLRLALEAVGEGNGVLAAIVPILDVAIALTVSMVLWRLLGNASWLFRPPPITRAKAGSTSDTLRSKRTEGTKPNSSTSIQEVTHDA